MSEYPKVVEVDGIKVTVESAADEARWCAPPAPAAPEPEAAASEQASAPGLEDVEVKMDSPAFAQPQTNELYDLDTDTTKTKKSAKKK